MMENPRIAGTGGAVGRTAILQGIALLVLLLVTAWIYWPGINGPFVLDDYENLNPLGAGAGIVADSVPQREWDETANKAQACIQALREVSENV